MSKYERANQFWAEARERVLRIARAADFDVSLKEHDDEFLFELFDYGERVPTDEEIVEALEEYGFE
ncbi:MAG: hypothetical protein J6M06_01960 [Synergistaceae bacterium]|nr:hypothetical protein [Synergistaceae bacterium]